MDPKTVRSKGIKKLIVLALEMVEDGVGRAYVDVRKLSAKDFFLRK